MRKSIVASVAALSVMMAGGASSAWSGDDARASVQPASAHPRNHQYDHRINRLIARMTVDEKLRQLSLLDGPRSTPESVRAGQGMAFGITDPEQINTLQHIAVEQSRLHIPMLFAFDTIHGFRTVFPIPLAEASSFDPGVAKADDTIAARESAAVGIKQIYSPMVDVSHEPRWGRIAEGSGEDPYLGSVMAATKVHAAQGSDYSAANKVATSPKHFVAYGQPEGGREYNTTDMSESRLRNLYLPPYKAAVRAGADTIMCSFNALNGHPGCANHHTETDILKHEWGFDGFIESDYTAVAELRACPPKDPDSGPCGHGVAADGPEAAAKALNAGTDAEMISTYYVDFGKQLLARHQISMRRLDDAVRRVLRVKFRAGLFTNPYADVSQVASKTMRPADVAAERKAAGRSMVLLKNDGNALPLSSDLKSVAVVGPLADDQRAPLGWWKGNGQTSDVVSVLAGIKSALPDAHVTYAQGCDVECTSNDGFADAVKAAQSSDVTVLVLGESATMTGEAGSRSDLTLPGNQEALVQAVKDTGKPFVVVLLNGHPLTISYLDKTAPAILEAWFPGIQAGNAVADVLFGAVNPGGKLPVTFPRTVGQIPIYYNHEPTGRPCDPNNRYTSKYIDLPCSPLYPFGYGLSYTTFDVSNLQLSSATMGSRGRITATVDVTNTGNRTGDDVVQLYVHDPVASLSQPVRRLRGFQRVTLAAGETTAVHFTLDRSDVGFYDNSGRFRVEPGEIDVYAGDSSRATLEKSFQVVR